MIALAHQCVQPGSIATDFPDSEFIAAEPTKPESTKPDSTTAKSTTTESTTSGSTDWQPGFLAILPDIQRIARAMLCSLRAEAKEDAIAEVVASTLCAYRRLHERGKVRRAFASTLTRYAVAQFYHGRRVGTAHRSGDVYSRRARLETGDRACNWHDCLVDNRRTAIPTQVAFRLDFPRWLGRLASRNRQAAERLALGYTTQEVAQEFQASSARISQLRRVLADSWYAFIQDSTKASVPAGDREENRVATS